MKLYHGTDLSQAENIIKKGVDIKIGRKYLDFGQGFYLTPSFDQAKNWAGHIAVSSPCVLEFELNTVGLSVKSFNEPDLEWATFVIDNRLHFIDRVEYDCVIGPMADTGVAGMYLRFKAGNLTRERAIRIIKGKSNGKQEVLITKKAVKALTFIRKVVL